MSTDTAAPGLVVEVGAPAPGRPDVGRAFRALLWRDVFVTGRELVPFLLQVVLQPVFLLFVFGKVLVELGFATSQYSDVLLPGVIALTAFLTALQTTAFPLVIDFSFTKEIEDRLLAPLPTNLVAVEKIVFSLLRALVGPVSEALNGRRARLTGVRIGEPSLEDVFLSLTGRELR